MSCLAAESEKSDSNVDKRQIDRDTVVIGAKSHRHYNTEQTDQNEPANYVTPRNSKVQYYRQHPQQQQQQQANEVSSFFLMRNLEAL